MFRTITTVFAFFMLMACALPAQAADLDCAYTFTSQPGNANLKFCVSPTGTLISLEMPSGPELITEGNIGFHGKLEGSEGYGICTESPATAYWDYINDDNESSNWEPATLVSHTLTSVKISRKTSDGIWTLTQVFSADIKTPGVTLAMSLKNNTETDHVAYLIRYLAPSASANLMHFSSTHDRAFAWIVSTPVDGFGYGLMVQNQGAPHFGFMNTYVWTPGEVSGAGPNPCNFAAGANVGPAIYESGSSMAIAYVGAVSAKTSKTATIVYNGMY
jgi:hypothetical protein